MSHLTPRTQGSAIYPRFSSSVEALRRETIIVPTKMVFSAVKSGFLPYFLPPPSTNKEQRSKHGILAVN
jgi:hypothetical protein